jgi:hypothetical protein
MLKRHLRPVVGLLVTMLLVLTLGFMTLAHRGIEVRVASSGWGIIAYSTRAGRPPHGYTWAGPPPGGFSREEHRLLGFDGHTAYILRIGECVFEVTHDWDAR